MTRHLRCDDDQSGHMNSYTARSTAVRSYFVYPPGSDLASIKDSALYRHRAIDQAA